MIILFSLNDSSFIPHQNQFYDFVIDKDTIKSIFAGGTAGAILGGLGIYKYLVDFAGCGATVPLTGFGYNLWKGIKESIDSDGFLGLYRGGFKMAAVGTSAALIFSYLASLIFKPKMPKN